MNRFLRILLAWCLAAALPFQGFAAHAMQACAPQSQARVVAAVEVVMQMAAPHHAADQGHGGPHDGYAAHNAHGAHADHGGQASAQSHEPPQDSAQDSSPHGSHSAHGQDGKCSVCASCCHAAAITAETLSVVVVTQVAVAVPTVPGSHQPVFTGGLDRPPRA